jgi:hypothetical protein
MKNQPFRFPVVGETNSTRNALVITSPSSFAHGTMTPLKAASPCAEIGSIRFGSSPSVIHKKRFAVRL